MFEIRCHWCRKKLLDKSGNFIDDYAGCFGKNRDNLKVDVCNNCYKKHKDELHSYLKDIKKSKLTRG